MAEAQRHTEEIPELFADKKLSFKCEFCKKTFVKERSLMIHSCEKKKRYLWKDEPYSRIAFRSFQIYWKTLMRAKKDKTFDDFIDSPYYTTFIKYGKFVVDTPVFKPEQYLDFLIKNESPVDKWIVESVYDVYMREQIRKEDPYDAVARSIQTMTEWAVERNTDWTAFFRDVATPYAVLLIKKGMISPWALYTAGGSLLGRMSSEQLLMIKPMVEPLFWRPVFRRMAEEFSDIEKILGSEVV